MMSANKNVAKIWQSSNRQVCRRSIHCCIPANWQPLLMLPLMLILLQPAASAPMPSKPLCAHKSIAELIRNSPVIVKALAARIFSDAELVDNAAHAAASAGAGAPETSAILITLTPETIYKGASLLKMANAAAAGSGAVGAIGGIGSSMRPNSFGSTGSGSWGSNSADSAYQYEGQLNATVQPVACFDGNMLKMLPMELIAFGKLLPASKQQLQRQQQMAAPLATTADMADKDVLHISVNGLHRWTPQFENHIWKHLGWDDWSDFTLCSVTCGKGVQQRFRRCLLDNPLVDISMNMNLSDSDDDDADADVDADVYGDGDGYADGDGDSDGTAAGAENELADEANNDVSDSATVAAIRAANAASIASLASSAVDEHEYNADNNEVLQLPSHEDNDNNNDDILMMQTAAVSSSISSSGSSTTQRQHEGDYNSTVTQMQDAALALTLIKEQTNKMLHKFSEMMATALPTSASSSMSTQTQTYVPGPSATASANPIATPTLNPATKTSGSNEQKKSVSFVASAANDRRPRANQHKKRKSAKSLSTLLCEGYNIEQRNCNAFECSDDISDLLKFYKKLPTFEETPLTPTDYSAPAASSPAESIAAAATFSVDGAQSVTAQALPSSTPSNMGYIRSWHNTLNFTLMITLRSKNDSKNTATIFSIRNATHNLYLEACKDGLRLYLERDNTTEMLPLKFNLYDYRWHQVAISIQNGDFISIYVDCLWTNSFVVSKRLFTLPMDADVEIGRGFNGELQQLLVLPEQQERLQCSNKRTSINEVKRYIIDTFIDDYGGN